VGRAWLDLRFWRDGERTRWEVLAQEGDVAVAERSWQPWAVAVAR
jgi:hypothetical protein